MDNRASHASELCFRVIRYIRSIRKVHPQGPSANYKISQNSAVLLILSRQFFWQDLLYPSYYNVLQYRFQNCFLHKTADHKTHDLKTLHWPPLDDRINFVVLHSYVFQAITSATSEHHTNPSEDWSQENKEFWNISIEPKRNTVRYAQTSFSYMAAVEWNVLPLKHRNSSTLQSIRAN